MGLGVAYENVREESMTWEICQVFKEANRLWFTPRILSPESSPHCHLLTTRLR